MRLLRAENRLTGVSNMNKIPITALLLLLAAGIAYAGDTSTAPDCEADESSQISLRVFGDFRARQEKWNNIPLPLAEPNIARNGYNNSFRFRTRLGAALDFGTDATVNLRLVNMFYDVTNGGKSFEWPDELVFDNANLELRSLSGDGSRLVIGRQDIILGSGRLVFEGTPLDASRTTYFDGMFLHQPLTDSFSADVLAVYNRDEDPFAIGHEHRKLRGYSPSVDGRDEAAAGIFLNGALLDGSLPGSLYYIWKHESSARTADGSNVDNADIHTLGLLLRPVLSDSVSGELELAKQFDPNDDYGIDATLAFASLKFAPPKTRLSPFISANFEYLSGDDPDTKRNEAFNPLFSRLPLISELVIYCYDTEGAGNWNNLIYPHISAGGKSDSGHSLSLSAGTMHAEERNGAGSGRHRGDLYTAQWGFPLCKGFKNGAGKTTGHIRLELFNPGDYYTSDHTAYYLRWEVLVTF